MPSLLSRPRAGVFLALALVAGAAGRTAAQTPIVYTFTDQAAEPRPWFINGAAPGTNVNGNWPNNTGSPNNAAPSTEPTSNSRNTLVFPGSQPYTATNNNTSSASFLLNQLSLTATAGNPLVIDGNPLNF